MWTFCYTIGKVGPWCHWMLAWVTLTAAATITATTTAAASAGTGWPIRSTCSSAARRRPLLEVGDEIWVMRLSEAINAALVNSLTHPRSLLQPVSTHPYSSRWVASILTDVGDRNGRGCSQWPENGKIAESQMRFQKKVGWLYSESLIFS